ncbi:hypothetical protein KQ51_00258 [Candidatus Izimaplasma bacterium HR1]|jgi:hypothetical protein|uniref:hypothetical protein n=1 Tax=Candidatus Izimoplasma sp. HR1 TaxID=1541959 RepID=UPI0004F5F1BE|nr:hypothetical protein KQ51_00258 [Candidatus Izimaplasma bacterium HR1]
MKFQGKEYKLYEVYKKLASRENKSELEKEIINQRINFSRITFKEYRDVLAKQHLGYALESHDGKDCIIKEDGKYAKQLYCVDRLDCVGEVDYSIGRILDYDVPIKRLPEGISSDIEVGNIGLVSETMDKIYLISAKPMNSTSSLDKAVYEIITKFDMISRRRFLSSYNDATTNKFKYTHTKDDFVPAVMIFEGSQEHKDLRNEDSNGVLGRLIYKYNIKLFVLKAQKEYGVYRLLEE